MFSLRSLLVAGAVLGHAIAQTAPIAFTSVPAVVVAGNSYNITWGGGDGSPCTITLRQGDDPQNLDTVDTLVDNAEGDWWVWQVSKNLDTANNYALQITQGQYSINYSGRFTLVGGAGTAVVSYSGLPSSTGNATASGTMTGMNGTMSVTGTGSPMPRNTTLSTPSLTGGSRTFGDMSSTATSTSARATSSTSAPNAAVAVEMGSSAALVMGILAAVMCLH